MVYGCCTALELRGMVEDVPSMKVDHFGMWLYLTRRWGISTGWAHAIDQRSRERAPLDVFFELWDEYRVLVPTTIASVKLAPHHRRRGKRVIRGIDGRIERPDAIEIRQYLPVGLHHFRWHFAERRSDDWTGSLGRWDKSDCRAPMSRAQSRTTSRGGLRTARHGGAIAEAG